MTDASDPTNSRGYIEVGYDDLFPNTPAGLVQPSLLGAAQVLIENGATLTEQSRAFIGDTTGSTGFGGSDQLNVSSGSLSIGPLQNNGGGVPTDALLAGSVAIDRGDNTLVPSGVTTDARGGSFKRIANGIVDIGAFEAQ